METTEKIKGLNNMLKNNEIDAETYFNEIMDISKGDYINNINRFNNNLINNENLFINDKKKEINFIIKKSINLLIDENILIPTLPIFRYLDKTLSVNKILTHNEIINNLNDNKLVFLYNISKEDYIGTGSLFYRCTVIDK